MEKSPLQEKKNKHQNEIVHLTYDNVRVYT